LNIKKHDVSLFVFLKYDEASFENNALERAILNIKVKTKMSGGFKSLVGPQ
jgi:Transposase IS66 family